MPRRCARRPGQRAAHAATGRGPSQKDEVAVVSENPVRERSALVADGVPAAARAWHRTRPLPGRSSHESDS